MRSVTILLCSAALLSAFPARAEDCAGAVTQADMNACASATLKNTDAELNAIYRDVIARLKGSEETRQLLITAQRTWLQFRDAECAFSANAVKDGSIYPAVLQNCRTALTAGRVKALKAYLTCQEGDTGCPVPSQ
ncbi:Urease-associated protein [Methylocella tundrae]|uniref:Urease-associated protein n=1 Tax=Methylocella tundrae TaxID=227605 RepID=A0A8B6M475_METTU|nr:lysozyme inhibitor LprI family protein [Methylocella tundrae]VTZ49189.1 Urease-associated protein [Methylocella tundrae]